MYFPEHDSHWVAALDYLQSAVGNRAVVVTPNEFVEKMPLAVPYQAAHHWPIQQLDYVLLHKGMQHFFKPASLACLLQGAKPIYADPVFVLFSRTADAIQVLGQEQHLASISPLLTVDQPLAKSWCSNQQASNRQQSTRIVITTYNRPAYLQQTLQSLTWNDVPVLVVDDASDEEQAVRNAQLCEQFQVARLALPINRGLSGAVSIGLEFWLADPDVQWISCFNDDVVVSPLLFDVLERVQDPVLRPMLTGRYDSLHPVFAESVVNGEKILLMQTCSGQHLHAHRDYWAEVMPIASNRLGAPGNKAAGWLDGMGSDEDYWATAWAPRSLRRKQIPLVCVPDLVRHLADSSQLSVWQNKNLDAMPADPPLREKN